MNHTTVTISFGVRGDADPRDIAERFSKHMPHAALVHLIEQASPGDGRYEKDARKSLVAMAAHFQRTSWYIDKERRQKNGYWRKLDRWCWSAEIRGRGFHAKHLKEFFVELYKVFGTILIVETGEGSEPMTYVTYVTRNYETGEIDLLTDQTEPQPRRTTQPSKEPKEK